GDRRRVAASAARKKGPGSLPGLDCLEGERLLDDALLDECTVLDGELDDDAFDVAGLVEVEGAAGALIVDVGTGRDQLLGLLPLARQNLLAGSGGDFTQSGRQALAI